MFLVKIIRQSFRIMLGSKKKTFAILGLQLLYGILLSAIIFTTLIPATEEARKALDVFDNAQENLPGAPEENALPSEQALAIYQSAARMASYLKDAGVYSAAVFMVFSSLLWGFSLSLANRLPVKRLIQPAFTIFILSGIVIFLAETVIAGYMRSAFKLIDQGSFTPVFALAGTLLLFGYFGAVAFSLACKRPKDFFPAFISAAFGKAHRLIPVFLTSFLFISAAAALIILTAEANLIIALIPFLILIAVQAAARLFMVVAVKEAAK
ncbi:hypothetical protein HYU14_00955 [Candidatus Woesearchaeota archaeon]|nr:hypothetical protein [Candidatus Woesearchaeota archaeon]